MKWTQITAQGLSSFYCLIRWSFFVLVRAELLVQFFDMHVANYLRKTFRAQWLSMSSVRSLSDASQPRSISTPIRAYFLERAFVAASQLFRLIPCKRWISSRRERICKREGTFSRQMFSASPPQPLDLPFCELWKRLNENCETFNYGTTDWIS